MTWDFNFSPIIGGNADNDDESKQHHDEEDSLTDSLYLGMGVGFAVGFWGVCGSLFFNRAWRHMYFRFLKHVADQLHVFVAVHFKFNGFCGRR